MCECVCVCALVGGISVWFWLEFKRFTNTCALLWQLHLSRILFGLSGKTVLSATPGGCATMFLSHLLSTANVESWTNKNVPQSRGFLKQDTWSQHKMFHLFTWTAPCYPCARRCSSFFFYSTPASCQTEMFVLLCSQLYLSFHFFSRLLHCSIFVYFADEAKAANATKIVNIALGRKKDSVAA